MKIILSEKETIPSYNIFKIYKMIRLHKHIISLKLLLIIQVCYSNESLDSLIQTLEYKIDQKVLYDHHHESQIKSLQEKLKTSTNYEDQYNLTKEIFELYRFYNFDYALNYIEKNKELAGCFENPSYEQETTLSLGLLLGESGRYKEAIDALDNIDRTTLNEELINNYYLAYKDAYSGLSFNTVVNNNKDVYSKLYIAYQDSIYSRLDSRSEEVLRLKENEYKKVNAIDSALNVNSRRLDNVKKGSRGYSLITFERSLIYDLAHNIEKQKEFLILSAISDIEASVKDNASIGLLAKILFLEGDIDRAHKYINTSFEDANFYNSPLRYINIASSLPLITKAYNEQRTKQKQRLKNSLIFISILAGFLLVTTYLIIKQIKKLRLVRNSLSNANRELHNLNSKLNKSNKDLQQLYLNLSESNSIKEHYIGTFLNLYSEYIDKLDVYRKLVRKYIRANRLNTLFELSKSKKMIDEELEIFHKNFDTSFLHMHPQFVAAVNSLLKPDQQIILENHERLNTELRILALIKLRITSSSSIAKILRYSVNTIYNYRASIKNKAINKNDLEKEIRNIK